MVDNADDGNVLFGSADMPGGISEYLPESDHGLILFTTRSREIAVSVSGSDMIELYELDPPEAVELLENSIIQKDMLRDEAAAAELLKELTYLPLAITQAVAYINIKQVPLSEYVELLHGTQEDVLGLMSREFRDNTRYQGSQNAVATTWLVSFNQIRESHKAAADLLSFISCIEPKGIPQSLLPGYTKSTEQLVDAIGTLCSYAFLIRRGDSKVFDMHSLVHLAARIWVQREGRMMLTAEKVIRHLAIIFPSHDYANRNLWREYFPHAFKVLQQNKELNIEERSELLFWVGRCLMVDGRIKEAARCLEEASQWRNRHFVKDHPLRLTSQHALAVAYEANGQVKEAVTLHEQVVAIEAKTLAEDHPDRLASQHELAITYQANGQIKEAIELLEHVVDIETKTFAEEHPRRLASQHQLAIAYQANGQIKEAIELIEHVVDIRRRVLAEEHPDRLASQHALAIAYRSNGRVKEAIELLEHVVAIRNSVLPEEHTDRLASQHTLAVAYQADGQVKKAITLLEHVVAICKRVFAKEHPGRLASQHALAIAYRSNGRVKEAIELLEHVVSIRKKSLAEEHPDRLASQHTLAVTYQTNGQVKESVTLFEHNAAICKRVLVQKEGGRSLS